MATFSVKQISDCERRALSHNKEIVDVSSIQIGDEVAFTPNFYLKVLRIKNLENGRRDFTLKGLSAKHQPAMIVPAGKIKKLIIK